MSPRLCYTPKLIFDWFQRQPMRSATSFLVIPQTFFKALKASTNKLLSFTLNTWLTAKDSIARAANKAYRMFFDLKRSIAALTTTCFYSSIPSHPTRDAKTLEKMQILAVKFLKGHQHAPHLAASSILVHTSTDSMGIQSQCSRSPMVVWKPRQSLHSPTCVAKDYAVTPLRSSNSEFMPAVVKTHSVFTQFPLGINCHSNRHS